MSPEWRGGNWLPRHSRADVKPTIVYLSNSIESAPKACAQRLRAFRRCESYHQNDLKFLYCGNMHVELEQKGSKVERIISSFMKSQSAYNAIQSLQTQLIMAENSSFNRAASSRLHCAGAQFGQSIAIPTRVASELVEEALHMEPIVTKIVSHRNHLSVRALSSRRLLARWAHLN